MKNNQQSIIACEIRKGVIEINNIVDDLFINTIIINERHNK
jgi:hypothetical protein